MNDTFSSILPSVAVLSVVALTALTLTFARTANDADPAARRRLMRLVTLVLVLQGVHFGEEWITGLHTRLPELFGLPPMPITFFVAFNLFWIAVWALSVAGLRTRFRVVFFPIWFLALACVANGLAHPVLAVVEGGYFPGLWTSPLVGLAGVQLLRRLTAMTSEARSHPAP